MGDYSPGRRSRLCSVNEMKMARNDVGWSVVALLEESQDGGTRGVGKRHFSVRDFLGTPTQRHALMSETKCLCAQE